MSKQKIIVYIQILLVTVFVSCNESKRTEEHQTENNTELEEQEGIVPQETVKIHGKSLFPKFKVTEYCDAEDQDSMMFYLGKFGNKTAFNLVVEQVNKKVKITYRVIDDCCLKHKGKASLDSTKLNLFHLKKAGNPCECKCMYVFEFLIRKIDLPEKLFINNKEVEI